MVRYVSRCATMFELEAVDSHFDSHGGSRLRKNYTRAEARTRNPRELTAQWTLADKCQ
jgi:hypothetical protein